MDVRLAGVLGSPDGQLIQAVVGSVLPPQQAFLFDLFVEAVTLAAQSQNKNDKVGAGVLLVGAVVVLILMVIASNSTGSASATGRARYSESRR
jgi:purine-cytosine permease-like protein